MDKWVVELEHGPTQLGCVVTKENMNQDIVHDICCNGTTMHLLSHNSKMIEYYFWYEIILKTFITNDGTGGPMRQ